MDIHLSFLLESIMDLVSAIFAIFNIVMYMYICMYWFHLPLGNYLCLINE